MVTVLSRFVVANGMVDEVRAAFRRRPHEVDSASGFQRLEVLSPQDDTREIWLLTFWDDEDSFRTWHASHHYHDAHSGMPQGLKLVPGETTIRVFDHVTS